MEIPALKGFSLVGGTALTLLYGHRISVDLDLFSNKEFTNDEIIEELTKKFGSNFIMEEKPPRFGIFCYINNDKVDIVRHPHPLIRKESVIDDIRMFSPEDIIAMKVQAILGRGKKKDFWDIAELLSHYSVQDFINFHKEKYAKQNLLITVPQALTYFADAEESEDPISLKKQSWQSIKNFISQKVSAYLA
ncbi:nucleotidyl transferase AbiEii/AbiGii toxin family protein [Agriterribacter sp.]|uniref:nucleotidyl transferase AbiEii/AbiGii toxin family protein n=1 Tax=Agriterribacter sp. TaxID=2821509 RepID=UPI002C64FB93|nr:nucleotidyl transferase AbiEii/AbiGii toxin family protein [Agriterribacter sp.]HRP54858.1 nucleotidyl transferase AbiEii/AbiGii toxin family protein [Agriterribacter sp.]